MKIGNIYLKDIRSLDTVTLNSGSRGQEIHLYKKDGNRYDVSFTSARDAEINYNQICNELENLKGAKK